jgi:hypothetical protein
MATSLPIQAGPQPLNPASYSLSNVTLGYLDKPNGTKNLIFKPIAYTFQLIAMLFPGSENAAGLSRTAKQAKNLQELTFIPGKTVDVVNTSKDGFSSAYGFGIMINRITDLWGSVVDVAQVVCGQFKLLSERSTTWLEFSSLSSLAVGMVLGLGEESVKRQELATKAAGDKAAAAYYDALTTNSYIGTARNIFYLMLGSFGTLSILGCMTVSPFFMLFNGVGSCASSVFGHYHKKMVVEPTAAQLGIKV